MTAPTQHFFWDDEDPANSSGISDPGDSVGLDFLAVEHDADEDDLSDLEFLAGEVAIAEEPEFDALPPYEDFVAEESADDLDAISPPDESDDDVPMIPTYTVTNPPGTVSVTALMDGSIHRIVLSPNLVDISEAELEDEIMVLANLARMQGRAAQRSFILDNMKEADRGNEIVLEMLGEHLKLPTAEEAIAAEAELFARRYAHDHD